MSAEKEIVNFWYNKEGFFTINNIKAGNRDVGILALKFKKDKVEEVQHAEVSCSISGNMMEKDVDKFAKKMIDDKFDNKSVTKEVDKNLKNFSGVKKIKKVLVLGKIPHSRKKEVISNFKSKGVTVYEMHNILGNVIENLDTQYHKNDILRTLQLVKYMALTKPTTFAELSNVLGSSSREEFLKAILEKEDIVKEFRKTNEERLIDVLKHVSIKDPEKLALLVQETILNRRTRKPFFESLMKMQGLKKEEKEIIKREMPLDQFF